jgi:hypothetical protein
MEWAVGIVGGVIIVGWIVALIAWYFEPHDF